MSRLHSVGKERKHGFTAGPFEASMQLREEYLPLMRSIHCATDILSLAFIILSASSSNTSLSILPSITSTALSAKPYRLRIGSLVMANPATQREFDQNAPAQRIRDVVVPKRQIALSVLETHSRISSISVRRGLSRPPSSSAKSRRIIRYGDVRRFVVRRDRAIC